MLPPGFLAFGQINLLAAETKHAYLRSKYTGDYEEPGGLWSVPGPTPHSYALDLATSAASFACNSKKCRFAHPIR
jgi:hypothetical protein